MLYMYRIIIIVVLIIIITVVFVRGRSRKSFSSIITRLPGHLLYYHVPAITMVIKL